MPLPARVALATAAVAVASLTVASLALVDVAPAWGVLFFYVLPSLFIAVWGLHEIVPSAWRRTATPLRRAARLSRLAPPARVREPPPAPPARARRQPRARPERIRTPADAFALAARVWLAVMRGFLDAWRSPRLRLAINAVFGLAALALVALVARGAARVGWPLGSTEPAGAAAAAAFFLSTFALRALGWQRLFRPFERPRSLALVTSSGTAAVAALALPSRIDDAIAIGAVRRLGRRRPSIGTLALSLFLLGLMDMASLAPFAAFAAVAVHAGAGVRIAVASMGGVGVGAAVVAAALPSIRRSDRLVRLRLGHWLAVHAPNSRRDAVWAWLLVGGSWLTRITGLYLLLRALGLHASFALAAAYVVAAAGASALPVGPAGAATQAGVGAAVLAGSGIGAAKAVALAVAAQALTIGAGATLAAFGGAAYAVGRRRARRR